MPRRRSGSRGSTSGDRCDSGGAAAAVGAGAVGEVPAEDVRATFVATQDTIARCRLDPWLFDDLLSAFAQDVVTTRYETWAAVLDYCRRSANPVGRLVLGIAGVHDEGVARQSDAVCTALQLANFWQDLGGDWRDAQPSLRARGPAAGARRRHRRSRGWGCG